MASIRVLVSRAVDVLLRRQRDDRLDEEMQMHLDLLTDEYTAAGMPHEDARAAARRAFGGVDQAKLRSREVRGLPWLDGLLQDVRFAARLLAKDPRFTLAAVVALGLGIGVTNTVFTIVNTAIWRDLPFDDPDAIVSVNMQMPDGRTMGVSYADFADWRASATTLGDLAATVMAAMNVSDERRQPERLRGTYITANTFRLLRTAPLLGRDFLADDDRPGAPGVAIISYGIWRTLYGGDPGIIGATIRVNHAPVTIVGVMPERFAFPAFQDIWQPLAQMPGLTSMRRDARRLSVIARLADKAGLPRARAEIETLVAQLARQHPDTNKDLAASVVRLRDRLLAWHPSMITMMVAVGFVLLIACANVANLLLARAVTRAREIAIRASLGATRWRIVRQLLIECVLMAVLAGVFGAFLSIYGVKLLGVAFDSIEVVGPGQSNTPYWVDLSMNAPVYLFVGALCLLTAFAFGLVPALHISRTDVNDTLKDGGRGGVGGRRARRWIGAFVTAEIALTLVLLSGAGLLWRNFLTVYRADPVIDAADLVTMRLGLPVQKYATPEHLHRFYSQLDERLAARSDAFRATLSSYIPYSAFLSGTPQGAGRQLTLEGQAPIEGERRPTVSHVFTGRRYFETVGLPLLRGRTLSAQDARAGQEGAVVDQRFVAMFFPDGNPLGRRIQLSPGGPSPTTTPWLTIVGVVPTLEMQGMRLTVDVGATTGRPPDPIVYVPLALDPAPRMAALLVRRTAADERARGRHVAIGDGERLSAIVSAVREEVRRIDPDLPVFAIETMETALARTRVSTRLFGTWFGILAGISLVLATVGLYALTAYAVTSRMQEIGVRMALGARPQEVVWLFLRRSIVQLAIGLAIGVAGALAAGQLLQGWLTQTDPRDLPTLAVVSATLIIVSIVACLVPARRAAHLDPVSSLREE